MAQTEYPIQTEQLCLGLFVRLDDAAGRDDIARWPFPRKALKLTDESMINALRVSGVGQMLVDLTRSDGLPLPLESPLGGACPLSPSGVRGRDLPRTPISPELQALKEETLHRNKDRRERFGKCEAQYARSVGQVAALIRRASGKSAEAAAEAGKVVGALAKTFLCQRDVLLNVITSKPPEEKQHYHALNVSVLSMMVGAEIGLDEAALTLLGMGALFHDIGKGRMPVSALQGGKTRSMRLAVQQYYHHHPEVGARLTADLPSFPRAAVPVILQHHERLDGGGFPARLKGQAIHRLARIVAVVDCYDNLCSQGPAHMQQASGAQSALAVLGVEARDDDGLIPHLALKHLFNRCKGMFDEFVLNAFIRAMGIYPPGSVVQLSNGLFGMVVSTNPKRAARPVVQVHHHEIPRQEALHIDLAIETELEIRACLKPEELPREVFKYLAPSRQLGYYADAAAG